MSGQRERQSEERRKDAARREEIDRRIDALLEPHAKSDWVERSAPAADDPVSDDEKKALGIVGGSTIRDDAIPGVSDPVRDGIHTAPHERPTSDEALRAHRRANPPVTDHAGTGDGGIDASGGVSGGDRGNAGVSDSGAGGPYGDTSGGPEELDGGSRFDYDRGS